MRHTTKMDILDLKKRFSSAIPVILLFVFNIGAKQIFNSLNSGDLLIEGYFIFTFIVFLIFLGGRKEYNQLRTIILIFFAYTVLRSLLSNDPFYGLQKGFLGLIIPFLSFEFFTKKRRNELTVVDALVITVLILDIVAVIYKLRMGFFIRSVNFGVLGPITLGWLNGMAFLSLLLQRKKSFLGIILILIFFLTILWTGSKGPLISSVLIAILGFRRIFGSKLKTKILAIVGLTVISLFVLTYGKEVRSIRSISEFISNPDEYSEGVGSGSIGTRQKYLNISKDLFYENPIFGVGFGGWNSSSLSGHKYPHNVLFEILAELGFTGFILLVYFLIHFKYFNLFGYIALFGFISLMFSGDFSYLRYAIFPLLISYYFYIKKEGKSLNQ